MMPASVETDTGGDLPAARRRLDLAVHALVEPQPVVVDRDDGTKPITWLDSLLSQLYDAVSGQTGERSGGQSSIPIWADCLDELKKLDRQVAEWHPEWPLPDLKRGDPLPPLIARLNALRAKRWRVEDTELVNSIASTLEASTKKIIEKLNPEPVIFLMAPDKPGAAACPACGTDYVWRPDSSDNDKPKKQPALKVTKDTEGSVNCQCQKCHYSWGAGRLRMLAGALGYPLPEGCLE